MKKNEFVEKYNHIEEEFFTLDKENNIANISLEFNNPSEIFDLNYVTKTPILNDELTEWIYSIFELVPNRYKINLNICFDSSIFVSVSVLIEILLGLFDCLNGL